MTTFGKLKDEMLREASTDSHFSFMSMSDGHRLIWEDMNDEEYKRGYVSGDYEKPESPALRDMDLLDEAEYEQWMSRFRSLSVSEMS